MDSLKLALRLFPGDLHRAIIFVLIARMSCPEWAIGNVISRPDRSTTFSINGLAASLSRPFETVRRHVNGMIKDGICARTEDGIVLAPVPEREADIVSYYRDTADLLRTLAQRLDEGGVALPRATKEGDDRLGPIINAGLDICLVALENNEHSHWFELILHGAQIYENGRDIMGSPELARVFGNLVLTAEQRRPVTIKALSTNYGIPYATVRRHVDDMLATGRLIKKPGGYILDPEWTGQDERIEGSNRTVDYLLSKFRTLAASGVDVLDRTQE